MTTFTIEHTQIDIGQYEALCPDVNRRTLQRDLQQMVDKELIAPRGAARQAAYVFQL